MFYVAVGRVREAETSRGCAQDLISLEKADFQYAGFTFFTSGPYFFSSGRTFL
jgi:hypothetical protein